jgi:hypothetical protein
MCASEMYYEMMCGVCVHPKCGVICVHPKCGVICVHPKCLVICVHPKYVVICVHPKCVVICVHSKCIMFVKVIFIDCKHQQTYKNFHMDFSLTVISNGHCRWKYEILYADRL